MPEDLIKELVLLTIEIPRFSLEYTIKTVHDLDNQPADILESDHKVDVMFRQNDLGRQRVLIDVLRSEDIVKQVLFPAFETIKQLPPE